MTFVKSPSGLPESFEDILMSNLVPLLSSAYAILHINYLKQGFDMHGASNQSDAKKFIESTLEKS